MLRYYPTLKLIESPVVAIGATSEAGTPTILTCAAAQVEGNGPLIR